MTMKIESPRFGTLEVEPEKIIEFPRGLPGFEECRRFTLFHPEGKDPKYFILQSLDDELVAFHLADPARFGFNYEIALSDEETALIGLDDPATGVVAVMLTKGSEADPVRANLNAPLVINLATRRGLQHVFARLNYEVTLKSAT
jgi:flagellar assembly factor FliW